MSYLVSQPSTLTHIGISDDPPISVRYCIDPYVSCSYDPMCSHDNSPRFPRSHSVFLTWVYCTVTLSHCLSPLPVQTWSVHTSSPVYIAVGIVLYFSRLDISGFPLDPSSSLLPGSLRELFHRLAYLLKTVALVASVDFLFSPSSYRLYLCLVY